MMLASSRPPRGDKVSASFEQLGSDQQAHECGGRGCLFDLLFDGFRLAPRIADTARSRRHRFMCCLMIA